MGFQDDIYLIFFFIHFIPKNDINNYLLKYKNLYGYHIYYLNIK